MEPFSPNNANDQQGNNDSPDPNYQAPQAPIDSRSGQVFSPSPGNNYEPGPQPPANPQPNPYQTQPISGQPVYTAPLPQQNQPLSPGIPQHTDPQYEQAYGYPPLGALPNNPQYSGPKRKKLFLIACVSLFVILGAVGGVFGYYIPNKPENVYKTGLSRSGKALEKLANQTAENENLDKYQNGDFNGKFEFKDSTNKVNGEASAKFNDKKINASLSADLALEGEQPQKYNAKLLSEIAEGKEFPTTYFQIGGIAQLGLEELIPGVSDYDNKWIVVDESYVKSLSDAYGALLGDLLRSPDPGSDKDVTKEQEPQITKEDVQEVTKVTMSTAREFVFNDDPGKSVLVQKSYVGKEKSGDINTHRYKMSLNKQNTVNYCKAMIDRLSDTKAFKKFEGETPMDKEEEKKNSCDPLLETIDENYTFDMFVDTKYKLIHKFRFTMGEENKSYIDVGQRYKGGDMVTVFIGGHDEDSKTDAELSAEINTKTNTTKINLFGRSLSEQDQYDIGGSFELKPLAGDIAIDKPKEAIKIEEVLQKFGVDPAQLLSTGADTLSGAEDTERKTDINTLQAQLEVFYAERGSYPTLTDLNDFTGWRNKNMPNADPEIFKDPVGKSDQLNIASANAIQYGYDQIGCDFDKSLCRKYKISALLSDGNLYSKEALN